MGRPLNARLGAGPLPDALKRLGSADTLKVLACLFLPCALGVGAVQWMWRLNPPRVSGKFWMSVSWTLPTLLNVDYAALWMVLLVGMLVFLGFRACADDHKKAFLAVANLAYMRIVCGREVFLWLVLVLLILWVCVRFLGRSGAKWVAAAAGLSLMWAVALHVRNPLRYVLWSLCIKFSFKVYSMLVDVEAMGDVVTLPEHVLMLTGGFPCNFFGPHYTYASFSRSFLVGPYWEMARSGIILIYAGLSKLVVYGLMQYHLAPRARVDPSVAQLWWGAVIYWGLELLIFMGTVQMIQGMTRIYGYDVPEQIRRPWLAVSPMDFWRRYAHVNRQYLIKYIFFPLYRRSGSGGLGIALTFLASALYNISEWYSPWHGTRFEWNRAQPAAILLFWGGIAVFVYAQFLFKGSIHASGNLRPSAAPWRTRALAAMASIHLMLAFLNAPQKIWVLVDSPGRRFKASNYGCLWGKMLFFPGACSLSTQAE